WAGANGRSVSNRSPEHPSRTGARVRRGRYRLRCSRWNRKLQCKESRSARRSQARFWDCESCFVRRPNTLTAKESARAAGELVVALIPPGGRRRDSARAGEKRKALYSCFVSARGYRRAIIGREVRVAHETGSQFSVRPPGGRRYRTTSSRGELAVAESFLGIR